MSGFFTLKLHFGGKFEDHCSKYVGGQVAYFDMCSTFKFKLNEIDDMLGQVGSSTQIVDIWLLSNESEMCQENIIPVETEKDVEIIITLVECNYNFIRLYTTLNTPAYDNEDWDFSFTQMDIDDRIERIEDIRVEVDATMNEVKEEGTEDEEE